MATDNPILASDPSVPALRSLLLEIAGLEFPRESEEFAPYAELFVENTLKDPDFLLDQQLNVHYEFDASTVETIINCVSLVIGIVKTFKELRSRNDQKQSAQKLTDELRSNLVEAGLTSEKATDIASKYSDGLKSLI